LLVVYKSDYAFSVAVSPVLQAFLKQQLTSVVIDSNFVAETTTTAGGQFPDALINS
jgi:hypothetical protein